MLRPQETSASQLASGSSSARTAAADVAKSSWQAELARAVRSVEDLLQRLSLTAADLPAVPQSDSQFPLLVPESYLQRMQPGNPHDPLLRQVLPTTQEEAEVPGFHEDALAEATARAVPGLLHKYPGRVLLIAHGSCAVHCRYCFRRHYPYLSEPRTLADWQPALQAIAADDSIHEVLLSGGDPLILSDRRLAELQEAIEAIPHVRRLRIHTRLPIVLPARITSNLLAQWTETRLRTVVVVHANHAAELVADCAEALRKLVAAGIPVLNQAVLLKGVNDQVDALADLCERCIDLGVMPYYLHQLDRVRGTAHFEVPAETGRSLIEQLRARLPGYAVPNYVVEIPGALSKTPLIASTAELSR